MTFPSTCTGCAFYDGEPGAAGGTCHRYPPQTFVDPQLRPIMTTVSKVAADFWCGEWRKVGTWT